MRLQRANNGREMYQLVADENDDDELLQIVDDYEQRDPVDPPYTDGAEEEKLTLIATSLLLSSDQPRGRTS